MKISSYKLLVFLYGISICFTALAQQPIDKLLAKQSTFIAKHVEEKVYVQCDKPFYKPGENLWFTAFVRKGTDLSPTKESNAIRVEWINPKGNVEKTLRLLVENGIAQGDISLAGVPGGLYKLRVYTWYMKNDPNPAIFEREVQIQSVILPRLKMTMTFEKESYAKGEKGIAKVAIHTNENAALRNQALDFTLNIEGKQVASGQTQTDADGNAAISFAIPTDIQHPDGILTIKTAYQGQTESITRSVPIAFNQIALNFYPEGGNMVYHLKNTIAFQARNEFGKATDVKGFLADENGNHLADLESFHQGIGTFSFTPSTKHRYLVHLTQPTNADFALPLIEKEGYLLSLLSQNEKNTFVSVQCSQKERLSLVASLHGKVYWDTTFVASTGTTKLRIPSQSFPMGMAQLTLFDKKQVPQAERLVFVHPEKHLQIDVQTNKEMYASREKVTLTIQTKDETGSPLPAQMALSVANDPLLTMADDKSSTIFSQFLLESEIKGKVENPAFYFDEKEDAQKRYKALDYLLMTAGWRRYLWKDAEKALAPSQIYVTEKENRHDLSGTVFYPGGMKPAPFVNDIMKPAPFVNVLINGKEIGKTDEKGNFTLKQHLETIYNMTFEKDSFIYKIDYSQNNCAWKHDYYLYKKTNKIPNPDDEGTMIGVVLQSDGTPSPYAIVMLLKNGEIVNGANANERGEYEIAPIEAGIYDLKAETLDKMVTIPSVSVGAGRERRMDIRFGQKYVKLENANIKPINRENLAIENGKQQPISPKDAEVENVKIEVAEEEFQITPVEGGENENIMSDTSVIVAFKIPLFERGPNDQNMKKSGKDIRNMGSRNINIVAATTPGVYQADEGDFSLNIRGARSGGTVYFVDGVKVIGTPNVPLSAISSVQVYTGGTPAEFGDFVGGAIVIETSTTSPRISVNRNARGGDMLQFGGNSYTNRIYAPYQNYVRVKEFAAPNYEIPKFSPKKDDFRSTLYWNGNIETDAQGKASLSFYTSDEITSFRITTEGIGGNGELGRTEKRFFTQNPISLQAKLPLEVVTGDSLVIPISLQKHLDSKHTGNLVVTLPKGLKIITIQEGEKNLLFELLSANIAKLPLTLAGEMATTYSVKASVNQVSEDNHVAIQWISPEVRESWDNTLKVRQRGFPVEMAQSGASALQSYDIDITQAMAGTGEVKLVIYPSIVSEILGGIEGLLREPHGCFEQTSSYTYPNVLALNLLRLSGKTTPEIEKKALDYIEKGYKRLTGFESASGGFEWFGSDPGHEALTAYGIMEFMDMQKVWKNVDNEMVARTQKWLMNRRDGEGNFKLNTRGFDSFSYNNQPLTNAYIVWALSEVKQKGLEKEVQSVFEKAINDAQPYQLALVANVMMNYGKETEAKSALSLLLGKQGEDGSILIGEGNYSAVGSQGKGLQLEVAGLALMACLKAEKKDEKSIFSLANYIRAAKNPSGSFGNTQSTVLCLKALCMYADYLRSQEEEQSFSLYADGKLIKEAKIDKSSSQPLEMSNLAQYMPKGSGNFRLKFTGEKGLAHSFIANYRTAQPQSNEKCALRLVVVSAKKSAKVGETLRFTASLENTQAQSQAMSVIILPIPAGLSAQAWQLKELQEKKIVDYYEIIDNELIIYYRNLNNLEKKEIHLDLKAELAGTYQAAPARTYLYYNAENKFWVESPLVEIEK